ncbi:hypothetical protein LMG28690_07158 [Paraburkholderia caffeinilytica]|nr:hypothetical protein LMG28690_07158 [Paraburkholderia caffeinilytica]
MLTVFLVVAPVAILCLFGIAAKIDPRTGRWRTHRRSTWNQTTSDPDCVSDEVHAVHYAADPQCLYPLTVTPTATANDQPVRSDVKVLARDAPCDASHFRTLES